MLTALLRATITLAVKQCVQVRRRTAGIAAVQQEAAKKQQLQLLKEAEQSCKEARMHLQRSKPRRASVAAGAAVSKTGMEAELTALEEIVPSLRKLVENQAVSMTSLFLSHCNCIADKCCMSFIDFAGILVNITCRLRLYRCNMLSSDQSVLGILCSLKGTFRKGTNHSYTIAFGQRHNALFVCCCQHF